MKHTFDNLLYTSRTKSNIASAFLVNCISQPDVKSLWEYYTGMKWFWAKILDFTDGSEEQNFKLKMLLITLKQDFIELIKNKIK